MVDFNRKQQSKTVDEGTLLKYFHDVGLYASARCLIKDFDGANGVNFDFGLLRGDVTVLDTTKTDLLDQQQLGVGPILEARLAGKDPHALNTALGVLIRYGREKGFAQLYAHPRTFSLPAYWAITQQPGILPRAHEDDGWHLPLHNYGSHDFQDEIQENVLWSRFNTPFTHKIAEKWFNFNKHGSGRYNIRSGWRLTDKKETDNDVGIITIDQNTGWLRKETPLKVTLAYKRKTNTLEAVITPKTPDYFTAALHAAEDIAAEFKTTRVPTLRIIPTNDVGRKAAEHTNTLHYDAQAENEWVHTGEHRVPLR